MVEFVALHLQEIAALLVGDRIPQARGAATHFFATALSCHHRRTATIDQIASTNPKGQAPWRNP